MSDNREGLVFLGEMVTKVKAAVTVKLGGATVFMDQVSIRSDKARKAFAEAIAEKVPALTVEAAQDELLKLADQLVLQP